MFYGEDFLWGELFQNFSPYPTQKASIGGRVSVFKATDGMCYVGAVGYSVEIAETTPPPLRGPRTLPQASDALGSAEGNRLPHKGRTRVRRVVS